MLRHPLPSPGSARVRSPASSVLRGAPTPDPPSRRASLPSRAGTAPPLVRRSCGTASGRSPGLGCSIGRPPRSAGAETIRSPRFLGNPLVCMPRSSTPASSADLAMLRYADAAFRLTNDVGAREHYLSRLNHAACTLPVYASQGGSLRHHATLGSGWWPPSAGREWVPAGFRKKVSETFWLLYISFPSSRLCLAH